MRDTHWPITDGPFAGIAIDSIPTQALWAYYSSGMGTCWQQEAIAQELFNRGYQVPQHSACGFGGLDVSDGPMDTGDDYFGARRGSRGGGSSSGFSGYGGSPGGSRSKSRKRRPRPDPNYHEWQPPPPPPDLNVAEDHLSRIRREAAKKYHPDKASGSEDVMRAVNTILDQIEAVRKKV